MAVEARAKAHRSHNKNTIVESTITATRAAGAVFDEGVYGDAR